LISSRLGFLWLESLISFFLGVFFYAHSTAELFFRDAGFIFCSPLSLDAT